MFMQAQVCAGDLTEMSLVRALVKLWCLGALSLWRIGLCFCPCGSVESSIAVSVEAAALDGTGGEGSNTSRLS